MQRSINMHLNRAQAEFDTLTIAVDGVLASAFADKDLAYPKVRNAAAAKIERIISSFSDGAINSSIAQITEEAARNLSIELNAAIPVNTILLGHQANVQSVTELKAAIGKVMTSIYGSATKAISKASVEKAMGEITVKTPAKAEAMVSDSIGRRLSAKNYLITAIRKHLVDAYVSAYSAIASGIGQDTIALIYDDQAHRNHGLLLSISGRGPHPSLASKKREMFHPNTTANLEIRR